MDTNEPLLTEIMNLVSQIPLESQERVRDVLKAMLYTREVVEKEKEEKSS